jgi:hypothetical protein
MRLFLCLQIAHPALGAHQYAQIFADILNAIMIQLCLIQKIIVVSAVNMKIIISMFPQVNAAFHNHVGLTVMESNYITIQETTRA